MPNQETVCIKQALNHKSFSLLCITASEEDVFCSGIHQPDFRADLTLQSLVLFFNMGRNIFRVTNVENIAD